MKRAEEVEALFIAAERRLGLNLSRSSKYDVHAERLREILAHGEVPLRNGRPSVAWVARELGIWQSGVRLSPALMSVIGAYVPSAAAQPDVCFVRGISHEKAERSLALLGSSRAAVSHTLKVGLAGLSSATAKRIWTVFFDFLAWLNHAGRRDVLCAWQDGRPPNKTQLEAAAWAWRQGKISDVELKATTASNNVGNLRRALELLARADLAPDIAPLSAARGARRKIEPRSSVGQSTRDPVSAALDAQAQTLGLEAWSKDRAQFVAALRDEAERVTSKSDVVDAMRELNRARLSELRSACTAVCIEARRKWDAGKRLLKTRQHSRPASFEALAARARLGGDEQLLGDYLYSLMVLRRGLVPKGQDRTSPHHVVLLRLGGYDQVAGHLHALCDAVAATALLYLIDSGANVPVARALLIDGVQPSAQAGYCTVASNKDSAGGKAIRADLPTTRADGELSSVEAMRSLQEITAVLRENALPELRKFLFLHRPSLEVKAIQAFSLNALLGAIAATRPALEGLRLTPAMIRPSVFLDVALTDEGRLAAVKAVAHHATATQSDGYTRKYPVRLAYEQRVRQFQSAIEAIVVMNAGVAPASLGLTPHDTKQRADEAARTGLGTYCRSPRASPQPDVSAGMLCNRLDLCASCDLRVVVAEPASIADLILFREALRRAEPTWLRDRPQRWEEVWVPWLALSEAVIERMARGPLARVLRDARELSESRKAAGERLIEPW